MELQESITFVENIIDEIDDLENDARPCKDLISVSRSQYEESFPEFAKVFDTNATEFERINKLQI